jgi:hypothetical protein
MAMPCHAMPNPQHTHAMCTSMPQNAQLRNIIGKSKQSKQANKQAVTNTTLQHPGIVHNANRKDENRSERKGKA